MEALVVPAKKAEELLAKGLDDPEAHRFALGRWAEAGRLAARSEDAGALRRVVRRDPGARSIDGVAMEVEALDNVLGRSDLDARDFDQAVTAFKGIIAELAG